VHRVAFPDPFVRTSQPPHTVAVIPARYDSTRFPGKILADLDGRPMIEHVYRRAAAARGIDAVVAATDDPRIADAVRNFGGIVRMTSADHRTGTDRTAEVARDLRCEIVVSVQGDEPLIEPDVITQIVEPFRDDPSVQMVTPCRRITDAGEYTDPHVVKVVASQSGNALYFSRAPIPSGPPKAGPYLVDAGTGGGRPHGRETAAAGFSRPIFKHLGLYAYRREFLLRFAALPQTPLELAESLEQLRALEHGFPIRIVETEYDSVGVDTPADLERARLMLQASRAGEVA
jgi:3-deoxy-manno-octulosonate cytidylyltransferase (CMP-KDO synthetase)